MSTPFPIAILNGTCSLRALILFCGDVPAIKTKLNQQHQTQRCSANHFQCYPAYRRVTRLGKYRSTNQPGLRQVSLLALATRLLGNSQQPKQ